MDGGGGGGGETESLMESVRNQWGRLSRDLPTFQG